MWLYHLLTWGYELASGAFCRARYTLRSSFEAVNLQTVDRALMIAWWHASSHRYLESRESLDMAKVCTFKWLQTASFSFMLLCRVVSYMVYLISKSESAKQADMQHCSGCHRNLPVS